MDGRAATDRVWDIVVVGAGPAGSTAARVAAEHGARTLLVDKASFPRRKTCAGGLTGAAVRELPVKALDVVETWPDHLAFSCRGRRRLDLTAPQPLLAMTRRERLDQRLVELAEAAGATFAPRTRVRSLRQRPGVVELGVGDERILSRVVVGADGCRGTTGRHVGVDAARVDLGLECDVDIRPDGSSTEAVRLDAGMAPGSYAWVFPKAGQLAVGVIQRRGAPDDTRRYLADWLEQVGHGQAGLGPVGGDVERQGPVRGHLTQWRRSSSPLHRGRVLVAGETAGLLEPWTREGISFALRSGRLAGASAAQAAAAGDQDALVARCLHDYDQALHPLLIEIDAGSKLLAIFERQPRLVSTILARLPVAQGYFVAYCQGKVTFGGSLPPVLLQLAHRVLTWRCPRRNVSR